MATSSLPSLPDSPPSGDSFDKPEPLFPREHWVALAPGGGVWLLMRKHPRLSVRTLGTFIAATLVARAAHGHEQMSTVLRWTPIGGGIQRDEDSVV
jgi:hypothetical protein